VSRRQRRIAGLRRVITTIVCLTTAAAGFISAAHKGHAAGAPPLPTTQAAFISDIKPLLTAYCIDCHNPDKTKGDLDLTAFKTFADLKGAEQTFIDLSDRVEQFEMPPQKSKQPTAAERLKLTAWVAAAVPSQIDCSDAAREKALMHQRGGVMSRRMNRTEYNNTIRDLIGLDLKPADAFPADGSGGEGFDNNGDALFVSPMLLEKYLAAAEKIINAALAPDAKIDVRQRILVAMPGPQLTAKDAARNVVANFARRAFRRPVTDPETDRFLSLFNRARQRGEPFETAIKLPLQGILISPHFLFLVETEPQKQGIYRVNDFVLASRLSYYLWSSMPDEELFSLARAGKLHNAEVLKQQTRRMVKDSRSRAMTEDFATQWLGIGEVGESIRPSRQKFPEYDDELAASMKQETILFFDHIFRDDRSLLELLDCDYTFANERLAKLYGIADVKGPEMRRVKVTDPARGGILGMASILTATSFPLRTSPVLRGKWVMESILGGKVPPPPPEAGTLPKDDATVKGLTFRQRLEKHRSKPECASCHQKMDPLGFGLENFDPVGRWRDKSAGESVDASGEMPNGDKFTGPRELKDVLLKRKPEFLRNFSRKMLGYALGRGLSKYDQCVIQDLTAALPDSGYRPSELIEQIVISKPFQYRYAGK
jgi:mono/diheme cytochrome c family protein